MHRGNEGNVRESLREIPEQSLFTRVVFLRKQSEIVA
jgi:hypothetical protein